MILFTSDYTEGAHPRIIEKLAETNMEQTVGYGEDPYCEAAREAIKKVMRCTRCRCAFSGGRYTDELYGNFFYFTPVPGSDLCR